MVQWRIEAYGDGLWPPIKKDITARGVVFHVSIDELARRVAVLADRARRHKRVFRKSEAAVRASLVEPFLRIWGWDTEDPAQVRPEFPTPSGRPNYALRGDDGKPIAFVGVRPYGRQEDPDQYITYCVRRRVGYFIATDGVQWEVYDTFARKPPQKKRVRCWNILSDSPIEVLRKSFAIARDVVERREESCQPNSRLTLDKMTPKLVKPPFSIVFPDGQRYGIEKWNELLTSVVEWLIRTGRLTAQSLPLRTPRSRKRYIVNTKPKHATGSDFRQPKKVSDFYVETHFSAKGIHRMACYALRVFGVGPDSLFIEMGS